MTTTTDIWEPSVEEFEALVDGETSRATSLSVSDFIAGFTSGELDEGDPEAARIAALLGMG